MDDTQQRWVPASELAAGDRIVRRDGEYVVELAARIVIGEHAGRISIKSGRRVWVVRAGDMVAVLSPALEAAA